MPVLECSIAPPDESGEKLEKEYPAFKYLVLAILFFLTSEMKSLRLRRRTRKNTDGPSKIDY
jgi:hypothetical protein